MDDETKLQSNGEADAYLDRNQAVLALAKAAEMLGWVAGVKRDNEDWRIVFIEIPGVGQVSWHIPAAEMRGHDLQEKRRRMNAFIAGRQPESEPKTSDWRDMLDERQLRLVRNCQMYASNDPAGVPGHNLMVLVAQMAEELDRRYGDGEM